MSDGWMDQEFHILLRRRDHGLSEEMAESLNGFPLVVRAYVDEMRMSFIDLPGDAVYRRICTDASVAQEHGNVSRLRDMTCRLAVPGMFEELLRSRER